MTWKRVSVGVGVGFVAVAALGAAALSESFYKARLLRGPYLQMGTAKSMVIVWRTLGLSSPVVKYGAAPDRLDRTVPADAIRINTNLFHTPQGVAQYEASVSGLKPQTACYYAVYDGTRLLAGGDERHVFKTYPEVGQSAPLRFAASGDSHGDNWHIRSNNQMLLDLGEKEKRPVDLFFHLGDISGHGADHELQRSFDSWDRLMRHMVMWISPGNHEILKWNPDQSLHDPRIQMPYGDAFVCPTNGECGGAPSGTEAYYSFQYGRVHFIVLDPFFSDRSADGPQAAWLKADLAKIKAEKSTDWIIVCSHYSFYGIHKDYEGLLPAQGRANFMPMLEAAGIDLLLGGHWHYYDRSVLFDGAYGSPLVAAGHIFDEGDGDPNGDGAYRKSAGCPGRQGTVQVVAGTGGSILGGIEDTHPMQKKLLYEHGSLVVDIDGDTLLARFISREGKVLDTFSIVKRGKVEPKPIANPKEPPLYSFPRKLPGDRFLLIPKGDGPVSIDGRLDEPAWAAACSNDIKGRTVWLFHNDRGLYVASQTRGPAASTVKTRDGDLTLDRESLMVCVDPKRDKTHWYEFAVNGANVQMDKRNGDYAYNAQWASACSTGAPWCMEIEIPWSAVEMSGPPAPGAMIGLNVRFLNAMFPEMFPGRGDPRFNHPVRPSTFGAAKLGTGHMGAVIPPYTLWKHQAGATPPPGWTQPDFDDKSWPEAEAGFGYGDIDNTTPLPDMRGQYSTVYLRRAFDLSDPAAMSDLILMVNYDDAFIAYLNGKEVLRVGVGEGSGAHAKNVAVHESTGPEVDLDEYLNKCKAGCIYLSLLGLPVSPDAFSLQAHLSLLKPGRNVLAVEGHNSSLDSKAFTIDPALYATGSKPFDPPKPSTPAGPRQPAFTGAAPGQFDTSREPFLEMDRLPLVQQTGPESAVVMWRTLGAIQPTVRIGLKPGQFDRTISGADIVWDANTFLRWTPVRPGQFPTLMMLRDVWSCPQLRGVLEGSYQYQARIAGLKPETRYYYAIYHGDKRIAGGDADSWFRTAPPTGARQSARFWVVGNGGNWNLPQAQVEAAAMGAAGRDQKPVNAMLYVSPLDASWRTRTLFLTPYETTLRNLACFGVGDVDVLAPPAYGEMGGTPSKSKRYYSFESGPAHLIGLDTTVGTQEVDAAVGWLKADLAATDRKRTPWLVVFMQDGPGSGTNKPASAAQALVRDRVMPLLTESKADLVFTADRGVYERPIGTSPGTVAPGAVVVVGNGGGPLADMSALPADPAVKRIARHGSVLADADAGRLTVRMIGDDGSELDRFVIEKK